jgi:hypothetical protein
VDANQLAQILNETGINPQVLDAAPGVEALPGGLSSGAGATTNGATGSSTNGSSSDAGQFDGGMPDLTPGIQP